MTDTGFHILIVDDAKVHRELLAEMVTSIPGVTAKTCASGFEALKLLPRFRFDLIITDIYMPDINGLELINFVKKSPNYKSTPLIVVTGEGRDGDRERALALGSSEFLLKPIEPDVLSRLVRRYLNIS